MNSNLVENGHSKIKGKFRKHFPSKFPEPTREGRSQLSFCLWFLYMQQENKSTLGEIWRLLKDWTAPEVLPRDDIVLTGSRDRLASSSSKHNMVTRKRSNKLPGPPRFRETEPPRKKQKQDRSRSLHCYTIANLQKGQRQKFSFEFENGNIKVQGREPSVIEATQDTTGDVLLTCHCQKYRSKQEHGSRANWKDAICQHIGSLLLEHGPEDLTARNLTTRKMKMQQFELVKQNLNWNKKI